MRLMEDNEVDCGDIGGKRDWKIVVARDSRCFGTVDSAPSVEGEERKLFMTRRGGLRYCLPPPWAYFCAFLTSLLSEYFSTRKFSVGPRGVSARRRFVLPVDERENRRRCETPKGPAIAV